jgi:hypothetical protein
MMPTSAASNTGSRHLARSPAIMADTPGGAAHNQPRTHRHEPYATRASPSCGAIHVFAVRKKERRGCPAPQTSLRSLRKLDCVAGHDAFVFPCPACRVAHAGYGGTSGNEKRWRQKPVSPAGSPSPMMSGWYCRHRHVRHARSPALRRIGGCLASAFQLALELVEETPVGSLRDDLAGARLDDTRLPQAQGPESHRVLGFVLPPPKTNLFD